MAKNQEIINLTGLNDSLFINKESPNMKIPMQDLEISLYNKLTHQYVFISSNFSRILMYLSDFSFPLCIFLAKIKNKEKERHINAISDVITINNFSFTLNEKKN